MELRIKKNGQWEKVSSVIMPAPMSNTAALFVSGSTCSYHVPAHSLHYYDADDRQIVIVQTPEVTGTSCPHCGAPVRLVNGRGKCNYCESFI